MDEEITDPCYLMGKKHLEHDIEWAEMMDGRGLVNWLILQKAIMNDYWADVSPGIHDHTTWNTEKIDMVMSKLYYCWVRMSQHIGDEE
jgi:hypothetical protein